MEDPTPNPEPEQLNRTVFLKSVVVLYGGMLGVALLLMGFQESGAGSVWESGKPLGEQVLWGLVIGAITAVVATVAGNRWRLLQEVGTIVEVFLRVLKPGYGLLLGISVLSGVAEELLFRGALQPMLGIWWAALLFMLAHAFVGLRLAPLLVYLSIVFLAGVWLGIAAERLGLVASMVAHAVHNAVVFAFALQAFHARTSHS